VVYDLLPPRYRLRSPALSTVGRLDRDTSGLLLLTDDGQLLHRIIAPKSKLPKVSRATLAEPLRGEEAALFASGNLMLDGEQSPLLPAELEAIDARTARLTLHEGRYHQARRMFAAAGNHVLALHRERVGGFALGDLPEGEWRVLGDAERARLFAGE
jgi:16S rRNA pseudouridine516 synthase